MKSEQAESPSQEYDDDLIAVLESVWGAGFMSPGGTAEVDRVLDGIDLAGRAMLDIGCGLGGATVHIAQQYRPGKITGIDIEDNLIERCRQLAAQAGADANIEFMKVEPGRLPVADGSLDVIFSKDSIIHIADKDGLARDIFRALKPGGWFAASDWLAGYRGAPSPEMQAYVEAEGLDFGLASAATYERALTGAGFTNVTLNDRNDWYKQEARAERDNLKGSLYGNLKSAVGTAFLEHEIDVWEKMIVALDQGQLRPTHMRARKPG